MLRQPPEMPGRAEIAATEVSDRARDMLQGVLGFPVRAVIMAARLMPDGLTLDAQLFGGAKVSVVVPVRGGKLDDALTDPKIRNYVDADATVVFAFEHKSEALRMAALFSGGGSA